MLTRNGGNSSFPLRQRQQALHAPSQYPCEYRSIMLFNYHHKGTLCLQVEMLLNKFNSEANTAPFLLEY